MNRSEGLMGAEQSGAEPEESDGTAGEGGIVDEGASATRGLFRRIAVIDPSAGLVHRADGVTKPLLSAPMVQDIGHRLVRPEAPEPPAPSA